MRFWEEILLSCELPPRDSEAYLNAVRIFMETEEKLLPLLEADQKKMLLQIESAHAEILSECALQNFKRGYRLCMELFFGCFDEESHCKL